MTDIEVRARDDRVVLVPLSARARAFFARFDAPLVAEIPADRCLGILAMLAAEGFVLGHRHEGRAA